MPVTVARLVREVHFVALAWFLAGLSRAVSFVGVGADAREWAEDYDDTASVRVSFSEAVDDEWILVTAIKNFVCTGLMVCEGVCILRYCKIFSDENETPSPKRVLVVLASSLCLIGIGLASIPLGCVAVGVVVEASKTLYLMVFTDWVWVYGSFWFARCVLYVLDHFDRQSNGQKETHVMKGATGGSSAIVSGSHALFPDSHSPVRSSENQTSVPPVSDMKSSETFSASQSQQVSVTTYDLFQKKTKSGAFAMTRPKPARESDFTDAQADIEGDSTMPDTHSRKMRLFLNPSRKLASQPGSDFSHSQDNPLFAGAQPLEMKADAQDKKQAFTKRKQQEQHRAKTGVDVVQADPVGYSRQKASNDDEMETWDQHLSFSIETTKQFDQLMDQGFCLTQLALPKESDPNEAVVTPTSHLLIDVATYRWDAPSSRADLENVTSGLSLAVDAPENSGLPLSFTQAILGLPVDTQATVVTAQAGQRRSGASRSGAIKRKAPETTGRRAVSAHDVDWIIYIVHLRDLVV